MRRSRVPFQVLTANGQVLSTSRVAINLQRAAAYFEWRRSPAGRLETFLDHLKLSHSVQSLIGALPSEQRTAERDRAAESLGRAVQPPLPVLAPLARPASPGGSRRT